MKRVRRVGVVFLLVLLGVVLGRGCPRMTDRQSAGADEAAREEVWTCSMHPQIRLPRFGPCPICHMDLIPASAEDDTAGPRELQLSDTARALARVQVAPVERRFVETEIRLLGRVAFDETRLVSATARVSGRVDRLYAGYAGARVNQGERLAAIYSPDFLSAQATLLQASRVGDSAATTIRDAVREQLRLWGQTPRQIEEIEERGSVSEWMEILSPISGVVAARNVLPGDFVDVGTPLLSLVDLSRVWLILDAFETDLAWIRPGQEIAFETDAFPGEVFGGIVGFVDPIVADISRTVRVRAELPNPDHRLKPGMFGRGVVRAVLGQGGRVVRPPHLGRWISPKHPEVAQESPGVCGVSGVALVPVESLGYASAETPPPLAIPATAPLVTGWRAVVYVEKKDDPNLFEFRTIRLGARAGDFYLVAQGLEEGERVAVQGVFKIDSAMQLLSRPSMMTVVGEARRERPVMSEAFRDRLASLHAAYFEAHDGLSRDLLAGAVQAAENLIRALDEMPRQDLDKQGVSEWDRHAGPLRLHAEELRSAQDIDAARKAFLPISEKFTAIVRQFGSPTREKLFLYRCPMAFDDQGADWMQNRSGVENPYFGSAMYRCGTLLETIYPEETGE